MQVDMYKETFRGDVSADINKENILASLDLTSNTSAIKTKNTKLNIVSTKYHIFIFFLCLLFIYHLLILLAIAYR